MRSHGKHYNTKRSSSRRSHGKCNRRPHSRRAEPGGVQGGTGRQQREDAIPRCVSLSQAPSKHGPPHHPVISNSPISPITRSMPPTRTREVSWTRMSNAPWALEPSWQVRSDAAWRCTQRARMCFPCSTALYFLVLCGRLSGLLGCCVYAGTVASSSFRGSKSERFCRMLIRQALQIMSPEQEWKV